MSTMYQLVHENALGNTGYYYLKKKLLRSRFMHVFVNHKTSYLVNEGMFLLVLYTIKIQCSG